MNVEMAKRLRGIIALAEQMHKFDTAFSAEPVAGFIRSLVFDLREIADEIDERQ